MPPHQLSVRSLPLTNSRGCSQPAAAVGERGLFSEKTTTISAPPACPQGTHRLSEATTALSEGCRPSPDDASGGDSAHGLSSTPWSVGNTSWRPHGRWGGATSSVGVDPPSSPWIGMR